MLRSLITLCLLFVLIQFPVGSKGQKLSSAQVDSLLWLGSSSCIEKDIEQWQEANSEQLDLLPEQKGKLLAETGLSYFRESRFRSAINNFEKAIEIYTVQKDSVELSRLLNISGVCFTQLKQYDKALETLRHALAIREKLGDTLTIASTLNNLASCFRSTNQLDAAFSLYQRSNFLSRKVGYKRGESFTLNNMGLILVEQKNFQGAIRYFNESLKVKVSVQDTSGMATTYSKLGLVYTQTDNYPSALSNFDQAAKYYEAQGNKFGMSETYSSIASLYLKSGENGKAHSYLKKVENLIDFEERSAQALSYLQVLSNYYLAVGNHLKSREILADIVTKSEALFNEHISDQIAELSFMYDNERVEQENKLLAINLDLEKTRSQKVQILYYSVGLLSIFLLIMLAASLLFIFQLRNHRRELERTISELNNLNLHLETIVETRTQDLLTTLHQAQESDKLKSTFLANMSHEIRTPLNGILGFAGLLNDESLNTNERKQYIELILRRGRNLLQIINDVVNISLIDSRQIEIQPISFNLNRLLYDLYAMFNSQEYDRKAGNVELKLSLSLSDSRSFIISDPNRIEQVITNLLDNAFRYTSSGSVEYGYELLPNNTIKFFVKDTGIGIPLDDQDTIFNRFKSKQKVDSKKGVGLGLPICKALIDMLNGRIWFETVADEGTTFNFTIPFVPGKPDSSVYISRSSVSSQSLSFSGKVILIVEDDLISYQFIEAMLRSTDAKLIHAKNGEDAIEIAHLRSDINLIIMDMRLPFINGYEATNQIKRFRPNINIIAQTANAMSDDRNKCIKAGCDDYIAKPLDPDEFLRMVAHYLNKPVLA